ncbi:hypothetical protein YC2023_108234 [Brassica napus]
MSTTGRERHLVLRIFKGRRECTGHHATCGALPAAGPYLRLSCFQGGQAVFDVVIRSATEPEVNPKPYSTSQGANQDIRARNMPYLTNQEGLNHEANFYGFYTQEGVQAN